MEDKHTAGLAVEVTAENWSGRLTVRSALDGGVINGGVARYRDLASRHLETMQTEHSEEDIILIRSRFVQARLDVAIAARTRLYVAGEELRGQGTESRTERGTGRRTECLADGAVQDIEIDVASGGAVAIEKIAALFTSADKAASEAGLEAVEQLTRAPPPASAGCSGRTGAPGSACGASATSTSARRTRSRPR